MAVLFALFDVSKEEIYETLVDYARYAVWTADVTEAAVLDRESDIVVAEFVSPELLEEKYVLEFVHSPSVSIIYNQVDQFDGQGLRGNWQLEDSSEGRGCVLKGEMHLRTHVWQHFSNEKKVELILQRRFDALQQFCSGSPSDQWAILSL